MGTLLAASTQLGLSEVSGIIDDCLRENSGPAMAVAGDDVANMNDFIGTGAYTLTGMESWRLTYRDIGRDYSAGSILDPQSPFPFGGWY